MHLAVQGEACSAWAGVCGGHLKYTQLQATSFLPIHAINSDGYKQSSAGRFVATRQLHNGARRDCM